MFEGLTTINTWNMDIRYGLTVSWFCRITVSLKKLIKYLLRIFYPFNPFNKLQYN